MKNLKYAVATLLIIVAGNAGPAFAQGDAQNGQALFQHFCQACHTVEGDRNRVGPYLAGVWDRPVATAQGYHYTKAMQTFAEAQGHWTDDRLEAFLINPRSVVKGTRMAFAGVQKAQPAADLAAYLKSLSPPEQSPD